MNRRDFIGRAAKFGVSAALLGKIAPIINASGKMIPDALPVFVEVTEQAGMYPNPTRSYGNPNWGDFNGDGYLDLIVPFHHNLPQVYINNGNGTFTQSFTSGIAHGVDDDDDWHGQAFGDLNNDGILDLYITEGGERVNWSENTATSYFKVPAMEPSQM